MVAIILTLRANPSKWEDFWNPVLSASDLARGSPQWRLHRYLNDPKQRLMGGAWIRQFQECASCILWWNSWITGKERQVVKLRSIEEIPEVAK